jgi:hypothetical protein
MYKQRLTLVEQQKHGYIIQWMKSLLIQTTNNLATNHFVKSTEYITIQIKCDIL